MSALTFAAAWQAYRRAEKLLPAKPAPVTPRRIADAGAIAAEFDLVALDAWGVLNLGETAIATAPAAVARLRAAGKRLVVLSNSGSRDAEISAARLRRFGFDFTASEIITGLDLVPAALAALALAPPVGFIAGAAAALPALTAGMLALGDDAAAYDRVSGIVFLSAGAWSEARQSLLAASLARRKRPLIVANPDIASPEPACMAAEPGWYAQRIAAATSARVVRRHPPHRHPRRSRGGLPHAPDRGRLRARRRRPRAGAGERHLAGLHRATALAAATAAPHIIILWPAMVAASQKRMRKTPMVAMITAAE